MPNIWDLIILNPMINVLIMLSHYLFDNFGLTIIVLTILIRLAMWPLTVKQLQSSKKMMALQAQVAEIRTKYSKDKQRAAQEQMELYKKQGMNPLGCLGPIVIQFPIWIALYQSIMRVLAIAPDDFLSLSSHLYKSWGQVFSLVPLQSHFLWLDLAAPDSWVLLPVLVGGTMWIQQKMTTIPSTDPQQQAQSQMMLWMMPLMFAFLTLSFPSGLALYWVTSNIVGIINQYFVTGWGEFNWRSLFGLRTNPNQKSTRGRGPQTKALQPSDISADITGPASKEGSTHGKPGTDDGQNRRRGYPTSPRAPKRR